MEERINYLVVGLFVIVSSLALVVLALWTVGGTRGEPVTNYTLIFDRDISGLALGSPVRYLGVDVGQVESLYLSVEARPHVQVDIRVASSTPIDAGTFAGLAYQGVTGVAFISLASDPGKHGPLPLATGRVHPVIPTRDVGLAALLTRGPKIVDQVDELLGRVAALLDEDNRISLSRTLDNFNQLSTALADRRADIAALPARIDETLVGVGQSTEQLRLLLESARPDVLSAISQLNETAEHLASLTGRIDDWLEGNDMAIQNFISNGLGETPVLMENTQRTLREFEKLVAELRENPSRIIYRPRQEPVVIAP